MKYINVKLNYYRRLYFITRAILRSSKLSLKKSNIVVYNFDLKVVNIGFTDLLKGLISAYNFAKSHNMGFAMIDDKSNTLASLGLGQRWFLAKEDFYFNPFYDRIYFNYNRKGDVEREINNIKTSSRLFWFSNNNILAILEITNWQEFWRELFFELFEFKTRLKSEFIIGIHVRTGGSFGDFSDVYTNNDVFKDEIIAKIRHYINGLNLNKSEIYFSSDSFTLSRLVADLATVNQAIFVMDANGHSALGDSSDLINLLYDWNRLLQSQKIVTLSNEHFYSGVLPLYCSIISESYYEQVII